MATFVFDLGAHAPSREMPVRLGRRRLPRTLNFPAKRCRGRCLLADAFGVSATSSAVERDALTREVCRNEKYIPGNFFGWS